MHRADDKLEVAAKVAKAHFQVDPYLEQVFFLESEQPEWNQTIALLEVVNGTLERGVEPVSFAADSSRGIPYPCVIVEVSPREYEAMAGKPLTFRHHTWKIAYELLKNGGSPRKAEPQFASR